MAHHVNVLVDAGMLRVVRTRRVRAIDERYYGRTARLTQEFAKFPRSGDTVYGFAAGLYPTDHPTLPERGDEAPHARHR